MAREPPCTSNSHKVESDKSLLQNLYTRVTTIRPHSLRLPEVNVSRPVHLVLEGIVQSISPISSYK